ncbi:MAG: 50S ribosomal protein L20 [bacterium]|nr:50S ribosomal protein L20 [bacterium]
MARVKSGKVSHRRIRKVLKLAKGYRGAKSKLYRSAKEAVMRAGQYAFRDRKARKRDFRSLWIIRINAAARANGTTYRDLMAGLKKAKVALDRKTLAEIAISDATTFTKLVELAKQATA